MKDILTLTADSILAIPVTAPEKLYTGDPNKAKEEWRMLSKQWHPDRPGGDDQVMAYINTLYNVALEKLRLGIWVTDNIARITTKSDKIFEIKYRRKHEFELGEMYVGDKTVVFAIAEDGYDLVEEALYVIKNFKYVDAKMEKEFSRYLPSIYTVDETVDRKIIVFKKTPDLLLLRDVLDHFNGAMDPKHAAWITSSMFNLACYLNYAGLTHNDISPDTYFISPEHHSGALIGGWWYSALLGRKLKALPSRTVMQVSEDIIDEKQASLIIDGELIRATSREMLGNIDGLLITNPNIPRPLLAWLLKPATGEIVKEYKTWSKQILIDSFGKREYVELKLTADDLYQ